MSDSLIFTDGTEIEVGTMYCIGQNYAEHIREMGSAPSASPIVFIKPASAYIPDGASVVIPDISDNCHHEVELVAVIGKDCYKVSRNEAFSCVAGIGVGVDLTLRDIQKNAKEKGHPWAVAKGFAGSAPISKIVPINESMLSNFEFHLELEVNGQTRQSDSTAKMERPLDLLIEYISSIFKLRRGDVIFTGTPEGVSRIVSGDKIKASIKDLIELNFSVS